MPVVDTHMHAWTTDWERYPFSPSEGAMPPPDRGLCRFAQPAAYGRMDARLSTMPSPMLELEGTWEEILAHSAQLSGCHVRVTVLYDRTEASQERPRLSTENQGMLELLSEWERTPLTDDEQAVLDGLEQHLREEPFTLRQLREDR